MNCSGPEDEGGVGIANWDFLNEQAWLHDPQADLDPSQSYYVPPHCGWTGLHFPYSRAELVGIEVRAGNGWWTPLGKSLFYAHGYFHKEVALPPNDYRKKC